MLHTRLVVHRLDIDGVELRLRFATVVAVARAESSQIDWEVVADGVEVPDVDHGRHRLDMVCVTGADADGTVETSELAGDAVVVRIVDRTVVLRGDGPLDGLSLSELRG